jgi:hypothetical protein
MAMSDPLLAATTVLASVGASGLMLICGALLLICAPGALLLALLPDMHRRPWIEQTGFVIALSFAIWPLIALWGSLITIRWSRGPLLLIFAALWAIAVFLRLRHQRSKTETEELGWTRLSAGAFVALLIAHAAISLFALRGLYAGAGIDSYHHTLITQLFVDNGGLPANYAPYAPLATFSYHFGFHSIAGALSLITGVHPLHLVPVFGQLLQPLAMLTLGALCSALFGRPWLAITTVFVAGLISPLPAAMGNWGRHPQLLGQVVLPVLLALVWRWLDHVGHKRAFGYLAPLSIVLAGLGLIHYRVTLFGVVGIFCVLSVWFLARRPALPVFKSGVAALIAWGAGVVCVYLPWPLRLLGQRDDGSRFTLSAVEIAAGEFFNLSRLGPWVIDHPASMPLLALACVAALYALLSRRAAAIALLLWALAAIILSSPYGLSEYMDTVSVAIGLYLPVAPLIGLLLIAPVEFLARGPTRQQPARALALGGSIAAALALMITTPVNANLVEPGNAWVRNDDLIAARWLRANTPADARIHGGVFTFGYSPDWLLAADAAYWMPLLANRASVVLPMIYDIERTSQPTLDVNLGRVNALRNNLVSDEAIGVLRALDVRYVYVGSRGSAIQPADLRASTRYREVFTSGTASVFELTP